MSVEADAAFVKGRQMGMSQTTSTLVKRMAGKKLENCGLCGSKPAISVFGRCGRRNCAMSTMPLSPYNWNRISRLIAAGKKYRVLRKVAGEDIFKVYGTTYAKECKRKGKR